MDKAVIGSRIGECRPSVIDPQFDRFVEAYERRGYSAEAIRMELRLGNRDSITGWRKVSYVDHDIEMLVFARGSSHTNMPPGAYIRLDALGCTADSVFDGDRVCVVGNRYYTVAAARPVWEFSNFVRWDCDLVSTPVFKGVGGTLQTVKTRPDDARYRTKDYVERYARNSQITKDNDSSYARWDVMYMNPPYPLECEFKRVSDPVQGLCVIEQPNSTPELDGDLVARRYVEHVPIHICAVNGAGVTGTDLVRKMEMELRWVFEENPTGSQRFMLRRVPNDNPLGSDWFYDVKVLLSYRRGTA